MINPIHQQRPLHSRLSAGDKWPRVSPAFHGLTLTRWLWAIFYFALVLPATSQQPNGYINPPIYASGLIPVQPGTTVTTNIASSHNHPTDLTVFPLGSITTWTVNLPNPAYDGQIIRIACDSLVSTLSIATTDGSTPPSGVPATCAAGSSFAVQFSNTYTTWYLLNNTSTTSTSTYNVANVVAYGADPLGIRDSTSAINFALAVTTLCTYFPQGIYYISGQLNAPAGNGCIFGDSPENTTIKAYYGDGIHTNFNIGQKVNATASFVTGATTISVSSCPAGLTTGGNIFDTNNWTIVGTIAQCSGTTLTLQTGVPLCSSTLNGALTDSATPADGLMLGGALGLFVIPTNCGGNGDLIRNIGFDLNQPQTSVRANIVPFPPVILSRDSGRHRIEDVRVSDSNICFDSRGSTATTNPPTYTTSSGGGTFIDNFECGALTAGWMADGAKDTVHWTDSHFWPFGTQINGSNALNTVYSDGTNICFQNGRVDGLAASGVACFKGNANFTANAGAGASGQVPDQTFVNLHMDNYSAINVLGGNIKITGGHHTYPATATTPAINVSGGSSILHISHYRMAYGAQATARIIVGYGGQLYITDGGLVCSGGTVQCGTVGSNTDNTGILDINGVTINSSEPASSVALFEQLGGSLSFAYNTLDSAGPNVAAKFDSDSALNFLGNNKSNGWTYTLPPTTSNGLYSDSNVNYTTRYTVSGDGTQDTWVTSNSPSSKSAYFTLQNTGVSKWRLGNLGASNNFILQDVATSTPFMTLITGGAATIGEGALISWNGPFTDVGAGPTYSGSCPVQNFNGGQINGRFSANGACVNGTVIMTFAAAALHGYSCKLQDLDTPTDTMNQTNYSTTSVTFTGNMANNDRFTYSGCGGF